MARHSAAQRPATWTCNSDWSSAAPLRRQIHARLPDACTTQRRIMISLPRSDLFRSLLSVPLRSVASRFAAHPSARPPRPVPMRCCGHATPPHSTPLPCCPILNRCVNCLSATFRAAVLCSILSASPCAMLRLCFIVAPRVPDSTRGVSDEATAALPNPNACHNRTIPRKRQRPTRQSPQHRWASTRPRNSHAATCPETSRTRLKVSSDFLRKRG